MAGQKGEELSRRLAGEGAADWQSTRVQKESLSDGSGPQLYCLRQRERDNRNRRLSGCSAVKQLGYSKEL